MAEDPMDEAFNQIKNILKILDGSKSTTIAPEIQNELEQKLRQIEMEIAAFSMASDKILLDAGISREQLHDFTENEPKGLTPKELEDWRIASNLKNSLLRKHEEFRKRSGLESSAFEEKASEGLQAQAEKISKLSDKSKHMKKFKRLGGNKDWKPL